MINQPTTNNLRLTTIFGIIFALLLVASSWSLVNAQEAFTGPGGCTSKEECRTYCDEDGHKEECLKFAVANSMMSQEDADRALKFLNQTGPGGCRGEECRAYCDETSHREECINFAAENGLIKPEEAERFKKFKEIEEKGGPGGCKGEECREYCEDESHRRECFQFAKENGLINQEEAEQFEAGEKIRQKVESEGGPGGCKSEKECHTHCSSPENIEECVQFGAAQTGKSREEIEGMLREFRDLKDRFEERREMMLDQKRDPEFRPDFGNRGLEEGRFSGHPPTEEEMEQMKENYRENAEKYRGEMPPQGVMPDEMRMRMQMPEGERLPYDNFRPENMQVPPQYQNQYQNMTPLEGTVRPEGMTPPPQNFKTNLPQPTEPAPTSPTSYDRSKSFLSNVVSAFFAPFR